MSGTKAMASGTWSAVKMLLVKMCPARERAED
jgi:hypothetical protein